MYNNANAINEEQIEQIAQFMNLAIVGACSTNEQPLNRNGSSMFGSVMEEHAANGQESPEIDTAEQAHVAAQSYVRNLKDLRQVSDRNVVEAYGSTPESSPVTSPDRTVNKKKSGRETAAPSSKGLQIGTETNSTRNGDTFSSPLSGAPTPAGALTFQGYAAESSISVKSRASDSSLKMLLDQLPKISKSPRFYSTEATEELKKQLLSTSIVTVAPQSAFRFSEQNLFDYDFPPGLVTTGVAAAVIELFKRGGRLSAKSIHKLLRLGFRSFKTRPNTTRIKIEAGEKLTVVGDIHGEAAWHHALYRSSAGTNP